MGDGGGEVEVEVERGANEEEVVVPDGGYGEQDEACGHDGGGEGDGADEAGVSDGDGVGAVEHIHEKARERHGYEEQEWASWVVLVHGRLPWLLAVRVASWKQPAPSFALGIVAGEGEQQVACASSAH